MNKKPHMNSVLEIFWLIMFIATLLFGIYNALKNGFNDNYTFFIMSGMAFLIYYARRRLRLKSDN